MVKNADGGKNLKKLLSTIIPVHNKADTLPRVIDCLRAQDFPAHQVEIIFVADQCTDGSLDVLRSVQENGETQLLEVATGGGSAAKARNIGLDASAGLYCLFLDPDIIIPPDFFSKVVSHLTLSKHTACMSPVYGNSNSLSTWPFIVQDHTAWLTMTNEEVLRWAAYQERLKDIRIKFTVSTHGSLDHLAAPWVFCWSSALAVERKLLVRVGGFNSTFRFKGSEDLELGYRLHSVNARFKLMLDTCVFHMPQDRNRELEESIDRQHEREMLRLHPTHETEALCAFDGAHANPMLNLLSGLDAQKIGEQASAWEFPVNLENLNLPTNFQLIIGFAPTWLINSNEIRYIACPHSQLADKKIPLFGFALPFEDKAFRGAALVGLWQLLPEPLACRIIDEAIRVANEVYILKISHSQIPMPIWAYEAINSHDHPYWERTQRVRRSFFDFNLIPVGQDGPIYSFTVSRATGDIRK